MNEGASEEMKGAASADSKEMGSETIDTDEDDDDEMEEVESEP